MQYRCPAFISSDSVVSSNIVDQYTCDASYLSVRQYMKEECPNLWSTSGPSVSGCAGIMTVSELSMSVFIGIIITFLSAF